ncbi:MAG: acid phosphatase, partial [Proteobacteria bacterium]|nr:acid phosphatase [Pseudomonadota bacterium]
MKQVLAVLIAIGLSGSAGAQAPTKPRTGIDKIGHIIVIVLENHSFDNLYGLFPGADGIAQAKPEQTRQVDMAGNVYPHLPPVLDTGRKPLAPDPRFPAMLPNDPFLIDPHVSMTKTTGDLTHSFHAHQLQLNGGLMNRFAAVSSAGGLAMGHYDGKGLPLWQYAQRFTLADRFFQAAFGGSFLNHQWLICACTPRFEDAPQDLTAQPASSGKPLREREFTPDGYAVNTIEPALGPHGGKRPLLPPQTQTTIGDRLSEKGVDWAWYAGGWKDALAGHADPSFQFHHHPFAFYQRYAPGTEEQKKHLRDEANFLAGIAKGELPPVSFYKPIGHLNEHPGYADVLSGDRHAAGIVASIERSKLWKDSVIIVTYDEYGGFWDHVPPPVIDRWGPGSRIPAIIISPFARRGHVD